MNYFSNSDYTSFLNLSKKVGSDIELVQGAGGNSSIKNNKILRVKASGKQLAHACREEIFVDINLVRIRHSISEGLDIKRSDFLSCKSKLRPLIETLIHAIMPHKYVFHVHCVKSISWIIAQSYKDELTELMNGLEWISLPYYKPGAPLAEALLKAQEKKFYEIIFLENHGLIVASDDIERVEFLIYEVGRRLDRPLKKANIKNNEFFPLNTIENYSKINDKTINLLALNRSNINLAGKGSYYPDHVVFLGPGMNIANSLYDFRSKVINNKSLESKPIIFSGVGVFIPNDFESKEIDMIKALSLVLGRVSNDSEVRVLTNLQEKELLNWEAEKYRQKII